MSIVQFTSVALYLTAVAICSAEPLVLHVAPDGAGGAFASLEEARGALRGARQEGRAQDGAEVRIQGGDYVLRGPFTLSKEDSGTEAAPIRYVADSDQPVRLLGGRIIEGFEAVTDQATLERLDPNARPHVLQVNLKALGISEYGSPGGGGLELFFDGHRMPLARWPNEGFTHIVDVVDYDGLNVRGTKGSTQGKFSYEGDRPTRWLDEPDGWLHGYWFWDWSEQRHAIESIDVDSQVISLKPPFHRYGYRKGQWFYAYNLLCELDAPGEWFLDRESGVLYFWPPEDAMNVEAMVTRLPGLVSMQDVSHVTLQGLTLEGARGAMVSVTGGQCVQLNALVIRNGGRNAVSISGGGRHSVQGCDIYGMGGGGVSLNGGGRATLTPAAHRAVNNHIHHYAQVQRVYAAGVHVNGVGNRVANNLIHDAPHMAIGFGGNDHVIEFNEIHDVCLESNDAGAMYAGRNWTTRGHIIRHNHLYDINGFRDKGCVGVYLDDMFSSAEIYGNLFRNVSRAAFIGGGRDCTVENNVFIDCRNALHIDARALSWAHYHADDWITEAKEKGTLQGIRFREPPYSDRYPNLPTILDNHPKAPVGNLVARNIFVGSAWNDIRSDAKPYVEMVDNLTDADPLFVDPTSGDYRLRADSPAAKLGFEPIRFDKMGLFKSDLRASWPVDK